MKEKMDIDYLKNLTEKHFHKVVTICLKDNPLGNTPFAGFSIMQAVIDSSDVFKAELIKNKSNLGMTEAEIDDMVKEVSKKVLKEYIDL